MTKVKICGINDSASFDAAVEGGADWIGFVFFPPSPRFVTPDHAASLSRRTARGPLRVGLFVKPVIADIRAALSVVHLDVLQIYDTTERVAAIGAALAMPIWHAIGVATEGDLPRTPTAAAGFVIEAKAPEGARQPGGNAATFDWRILRGWHAPAPWLLAGGLTVANVREAVAISGAPAVDVSSGVETNRGLKSPALIRAFIDAAKGSA